MHRIWYQPTTQTQLRVIIHLILIRCLISFKLELLEVTNYVSWECKMKCTIRIISWERRNLLKNASIMTDCWELRDPHADYSGCRCKPYLTWLTTVGTSTEGTLSGWDNTKPSAILSMGRPHICFDNWPESRHWDNYIKVKRQKPSYPHHIDILWISLQIKLCDITQASE